MVGGPQKHTDGRGDELTGAAPTPSVHARAFDGERAWTSGGMTVTQSDRHTADRMTVVGPDRHTKSLLKALFFECVLCVLCRVCGGTGVTGE